MMSDELAKSEAQNREIAMMLLEQQESDRGCVIFGAAMLEDELESLLRASRPSHHGCRQLYGRYTVVCGRTRPFR